jgi:hypothetical protein
MLEPVALALGGMLGVEASGPLLKGGEGERAHFGAPFNLEPGLCSLGPTWKT